MAVSKYIQAVKDEAAGRPRSTSWYRDKIREFGKPGAMDLIRDGKRAATPYYGKMNMFFYDPKHKKKLPYYDTFPLVLPIERYNDGFLGINFHYLPIPLRVNLLDRLVDFTQNTKFDESTVMNVNYSKLKNIPIIKPALKHYLAGHTKSQFRRIDADEWTIAVLLPVQRFKKASASEVWSDSRSMI
jgi:hypothetical protein|tara:strand:- start:900 stop:1457 length:558 start_codon:yes stop_codon:yes gene_type:complete